MKTLHSKLDDRLNYIKALILKMGSFVEKTIICSFDILLNKYQDQQILTELKQREKDINALQLKVSRVCFKILARESPVAKDLRLILATINANTDLERMGDLAFNIASRAWSIDKDPVLDEVVHGLFEKMFDQTSKMVRKSLDAFVGGDERLARQILIQDNNVDDIRTNIHSVLEEISIQHKHLIRSCIGSIIIAGELERIADHATNIAEEIIFLKTGDDIRHQDLSELDKEGDSK